jgi:fatty acid synthase
VVVDARRRLGHQFHVGRQDISPLRGALAVFGLTANDVGVVSKHDSSTQANDLNEARLHETLQDVLGRDGARPLRVISQKALTGHPKGAAAAWQLHGLMQCLSQGVVPGNASLDDVDEQMKQFPRLVWSDRSTTVPWSELKAGLVTTLGFGHVSALMCVGHPFLFWRLLNAEQRAGYAQRLARRQVAGEQRLQEVLSGRAPLFVPRGGGPFVGRPEQEAAFLLDAGARL